MIRTPSYARIALAAAIVATMPAARATNGYFADGYGTAEKGLAGAGVALPQDSLAPATNPAGLAFVGSRVDAGLEVFAPNRRYSVAGAPSGGEGTFGLTPGSAKSGRDIFVIPHLGYARELKSGGSFGIAAYGNGGMNTSYPSSAGGGAGTFYGGSAGVNLEQLFIAPTYARKWNAGSAWGVSPIFAYQRFEAKGLSSFGRMVADGTPDNLTDRGVSTSTGAGIRLGVQAEGAANLTLGASYQTKIRMSRFDKYSDLFAQRGRFDIPPTGTIGLAYKTAPTSVVAFDIQKIWYSEVPSVGNPFSDLYKGLAGDPTYLLGGENGAGFGWRDMTVYKLGYQWQAAPTWTTRAGISYGRQPIPDSEALFNILAPGVEEWHFTAGFTHSAGKDSEWTLAATYAPAKTVTGPNPLDAPGQQTISLKMRQLDVEANWAKRL